MLVIQSLATRHFCYPLSIIHYPLSITNSRFRRLLVSVVLVIGGLVLQSCGPSDQGETSEEATTQPSIPPDPSREAPTGVTPEPRRIDSTFTIRDATPEVEACMLRLEREDGEISERPAALEVCLADMEPEELVGERVQLRVEQAPMLAPECEGDPTCEEIAFVDLIVGLEPVPQVISE